MCKSSAACGVLYELKHYSFVWLNICYWCHKYTDFHWLPLCLEVTWRCFVFLFFFTVFLREVVLWHTSGRISVCWIPCEALLVLFSSRLPLKFNEAPGGHFPVDWQQWSLPAESSSLLLSHWLPRKCNMKVCLRLLLQPEITQMMTQRLASLSLWGIITCRVTSSC